MTAIWESARSTILLADFANADATGKLNIVGGGVSITAIDPRTGQTAPLSVVVVVAVNPKFIGQQFALELGLYGADDGQIVTPAAPDGRPLRIGQPMRVEPPQSQPGTYIPPESVWPTSQMIVNFGNGLGLASGRAYDWRVAVDTHLVAVTTLLVAGPPPVTFG